MGVDHGLGGRDNDKSRFRRQKKAKRLKSEILRTIGTEKELKKEVIFNEQSRLEWLSGFHKRKQKRRQFGVAMQVLKDKKTLKTIQSKRKQIHEDQMKQFENDKINNNRFNMINNINENEHEHDINNNINDNNNNNNNNNKDYDNNKSLPTIIHTDEHTTNMFGSAVAVTIDTGIAEELDHFQQCRDLNMNDNNKNKNNINYKQLQFEKAIKQAKQKINDKKQQQRMKNKNKHGNNNNNNNNNKSKNKNNGHGKVLLNKAMGKNTYKGNKKK